jgi:cytochrome b
VVTGTGAMYLSQKFVSVHIVLTKLGLVLVGLHAAAALWHHIGRRDDVLLRMLPGFRAADREQRKASRPAGLFSRRVSCARHRDP